MASEENNVAAEAKETKETKEVQETKEEKTSETKTEEKKEAAEQPATEPQPPKPVVRKTNFEKDIVYLFQFSRTPVVPSLSPFCLKVETWLRLAGLKYENVDHKMKYRSKRGLLPFVELNGEEIPDSAVIIKELSDKFSFDLNAKLSNTDLSVSHAMITMIESHLFWIIMWWRTHNTDNLMKGYKVNLQQALGTRIPNGILNILFKFGFGRKGIKKVKAQGIGVHSPEEIIEFGKHDLIVLSQMLAEKQYFFGEEPTLLDVVAFANLSQIYFVDKEWPFELRDYMSESCSNLVAHVNRMKERCFPDWDDICSTLDLNSHLPKPAPEEKDTKEKDEEKKVENGETEKEKSEKEAEKEPVKETDEKEKEKEKEEKK